MINFQISFLLSETKRLKKNYIPNFDLFSRLTGLFGPVFSEINHVHVYLTNVETRFPRKLTRTLLFHILFFHKPSCPARLYALLGRTLCTTRAPLLRSSFAHRALILDIETLLDTVSSSSKFSPRMIALCTSIDPWRGSSFNVFTLNSCSWATNDAAARAVARDRWRSRKPVQLVNSLDGRCRNRVAGDEARACLLQDSVEHRNGIRSVFFRGMAWGCGEPRRRWGVAGTR